MYKADEKNAREPTAIPAHSMSGGVTTKRRLPFGGDGAASFQSSRKAPKRDMNVVYERTMQYLMANAAGDARAAGADAEPVAAFVMRGPVSRCCVCEVSRESTGCAYCERAACEFCVRQCDQCQDVFCSFCSTPNYDLRIDRMLCLSCNMDESARAHRYRLGDLASPGNSSCSTDVAAMLHPTRASPMSFSSSLHSSNSSRMDTSQ